jgi:hypothetical protein
MSPVGLVFSLCLLLLPLPAAADPNPGLRFAWPLPAKVSVIETTLKEDTTAQLRYRVSLARDQSGGALGLRIDDFAFVKMGGVDLENPETKKELQKVLALASAIPTLVISPEGKVLDIAGYEEMVPKVLKLITDKNERAVTERILRSPQTIQIMKQKSAEFFSLWVSFWLEHPLAPGRSLKGSMKLPMPDGTPIDVPYTAHHRGPVKERPGHVLLEMDSALTGEPARRAMVEFLQKANTGKAFTQDMVESMRRVTKMRLVTRPETMQPAQAMSETITSVKMKGEKEQSRVERHEYLFEWR